MQTILVLGASSTIAQATVRKLAEEKNNLILTARRPAELEKLKSDLEIRYNIEVTIKEFHALDYAAHEGFFEDVLTQSNGIDGIILMYGAMADQKEAERDFDLSQNMIDVNFTSAVSILNIAANYFEEKQSGFISAVSSVAGDRGRQTNYIYGSTKAALTAYLGGLRNRLHKSGVHVLTIKPGIVDTKMTYGTVKDSLLLADPETVGKDITKAIKKKKDVLYTPWFWVIIMLVVKLVPERIFKRTDI